MTEQCFTHHNMPSFKVKAQSVICRHNHFKWPQRCVLHTCSRLNSCSLIAEDVDSWLCRATSITLKQKTCFTLALEEKLGIIIYLTMARQSWKKISTRTCTHTVMMRMWFDGFLLDISRLSSASSFALCANRNPDFLQGSARSLSPCQN